MVSASNSRQYGTNLSERDTDFDVLEDRFEIEPRFINVNGGAVSVTSDPLAANSDTDLLDDGEEDSAGTNPLLADTDGDGTGDDAEQPLGRDPTFKDKLLRIEVASITATRVDDEGTANAIEPRWHAAVDPGNGVFTNVSNASGNDIEQNKTITPVPKKLYEDVIRDDGTVVRIRITGEEDDGGWSDNETLAPAIESFDYTTTVSEDRTVTQLFDGDGSGDGTLETILSVRVQ